VRVKKQNSAFSAVSAVLLTGAAVSVAAQQAFTGRISDSACGASHAAKASSASHSDRQCLLACINALAKYVLVDESGRVLAIANQDAIGLPLYAGRPVKIAGERSGDAITISKVEAIAAHLHLGHVMTNWRDTPGGRGFLPVALDQARAAGLHAGLAVKGATLDDIKAQAREVLQALDPTVESGAAESIATHGLTHLSLAVADPERSLRFYERLLGVREYYRDDAMIQALGPGEHDIIAFERDTPIQANQVTQRAPAARRSESAAWSAAKSCSSWRADSRAAAMSFSSSSLMACCSNSIR